MTTTRARGGWSSEADDQEEGGELDPQGELSRKDDGSGNGRLVAPYGGGGQAVRALGAGSHPRPLGRGGIGGRGLGR
jgi:hypothetical protein